MTRDRLRIAILGYIVRGPIGGLAWHHLQYVEGLSRLGHDVRFIEDSDNYPSCYDPARHVVDCDPSYGLRFAFDAFGRLGMPEAWAYYDEHSGQWLGPAKDPESFCRSADLILNLSGVNPLREWTARASVRVFVDTDPLFTQVRHLKDPIARSRAEHHNVYMSFGENIGTSASLVPDDGFDWMPTRQPIVLSRWTSTPVPREAPYTTVMQWQSYPSVEINGQSYGAKAASFEQFADVPAATEIRLELALGSENAPREELAAKGWSIRDPLAVALSPWDYQEYLSGSKGEVAVAKQGYVISNCGWFSERSAAYLASGRPVVTQETGFSEWLPTGAGVFSFRTPDELISCLEEVERDHEFHASAARSIAEEYFDSNIVLESLVERSTAVAR